MVVVYLVLSKYNL